MNYYLICFLLSALLTAVHMYRWQNRYGLHFSLMYIFATIANMGYWQIHDTTQLSHAILANKIAYIGGCFSTLSLLLCIFSVCKIKISKRVSALLYMITFFVYGTALTVGYNGMFYKNASLELVDGHYKLVKEYAFFHTVFYVMLISYVLISFIALVIGFRKKQEVSLKSIVLMFIVMLLNFLSFFGGRALFDVELIAASYVITEIIVVIITDRLILYNIDEMVISTMLGKGEMGAASFDFDYAFLGCNDVARSFYLPLNFLAVDKRVNGEKEELKELISWMDILKKDGIFETIFEKDERWIKVSGKFLFDKDKKRGYTFVFTDFTEEKQRQDELVRVSTKAKSDVLARMSHEIRTPINAILGLNEMILRTTEFVGNCK